LISRYYKHLSWVCKKLGIKALILVFDCLKKCKNYIRRVVIRESGKIDLFNGHKDRYMTKKMIGHIYMMKLNLLIVEKVHVFAVANYSLISKQPLGGLCTIWQSKFWRNESFLA
jgi:DNA-directed RNA polymerase beta subunit